VGTATMALFLRRTVPSWRCPHPFGLFVFLGRRWRDGFEERHRVMMLRSVVTRHCKTIGGGIARTLALMTAGLV